MPVYKTGRKVKLEKVVKRTRATARRVFGKPRYWLENNTAVKLIEWMLRYPVKDHVAKLAKRTKPVVVDWGCGGGAAAAEVAKTVQESKVYGFSANSHKDWNTIINGDKKKGIKPVKNVKFIHADAEDFFRYFKDNSIDFLYSRLGICHLDSQAEYLKRLVPKLKPGGIIVTDTGSGVKNFIALIGFNTKSKTAVRRNANWKYEVEVYQQPGYYVEFIKGDSTIIIKRKP